MQERLQFYIDGKWVNPTTPKIIDVINPALGASARVALELDPSAARDLAAAILEALASVPEALLV